jgi:argininosuccinate synthase
VRFELGAYALKPGIRVIAPWREWDLGSRESLMAYCRERDIPVDFAAAGKKSPYSMDANLLHISYEGGLLEDPWTEAEESMWRWSVSPEEAPDAPAYLDLEFRGGDIVAIDGKAMSPATVHRNTQSARRCQRRRPRRYRREPLRRHEVPRLLRDARRYHHAQGASRDRVDHPRPRGGAPEG